MYAWAGTILKVDLTSRVIEKEPLSKDFAQKYLGSSGFNAAKFLELVKPEVDALSPENVFMIGLGPLSGTAFPGSSRVTIAAKSPLTDLYGDSNIGEHFGTEVKLAGYDQILVFGRSEQPVYLWINNDEVEIRDASQLWGKSTWDTATMIRDELGDPDIQVACIGQAGENLVRFACVIVPTKAAAGRGGLGAVMGSKNLKAVAVRGSKGIAVAKPEEFMQVCKETRTRITKGASYASLHEYGTTFLQEGAVFAGLAGTRNFQTTLFPNIEAVSGKRFKKEFALPMTACTACPVACRVHYIVKSGEFAGISGGGPEFGATQMGLRCDIDNMEALLMENELFNKYGLDCISAGALFAWAMDCYEHGILTKEDFDGTPLSWGDYHATIDMTHKIVRREGFGAILAEGEKKAPQLVGRGSEKYMHIIKGRAPVVEDPRANRQFGFAYYTSLTGEPHLQANVIYVPDLFRDSDIGKWMRKDPDTLNPHSPKDKGKLVKLGEDYTQIIDAAGICTRTGGSINLVTRAISSATGIEFTEEEMLKTGERIVNVQKALNSRQGLTRKDDNFSVPEKFTKEPIKEGLYKDSVVELDMMLDDYYQARGWDLETGLQTKEKLRELGLEHIIAELEKVDAVK